MLSKPIYTIVYRCTSFNVDFGQIYIYFNILIKQNETAMVINRNSLSSHKKQYRCDLGPDFGQVRKCVCGGGGGGEGWECGRCGSYSVIFILSLLTNACNTLILFILQENELIGFNIRNIHIDQLLQFQYLIDKDVSISFSSISAVKNNR